jgi:hypothetical protein
MGSLCSCESPAMRQPDKLFNAVVAAEGQFIPRGPGSVVGISERRRGPPARSLRSQQQAGPFSVEGATGGEESIC